MAAKKEPEEETITMLRSDHEFAIHEAHVDGAAMERHGSSLSSRRTSPRTCSLTSGRRCSLICNVSLDEKTPRAWWIPWGSLHGKEP